ADAKCQALADAAELPGTYLAWLSTDEANGTPATRFTQWAGPYVKVDGVSVADNWADLIDGDLDSQIDKTELGDAAPIGTTNCSGGNFPTVWTGTGVAGTLIGPQTCNSWTSNGPDNAFWGLASEVDPDLIPPSAWTEWCTGPGCSSLSSLYCFQQ